MSENIAIAEWQRAEECRQVARLCLQGGFYANAVSRAYYAALHAARAALALYDVTPKNHRGLSNLFGLHIVKPGLVETRWGSVIGQLSDRRLDADYNVTVIFSQADAANACEQADAFAERIHALLGGIVDSWRLPPSS